jgi:hypothetical protein
MRITLALLVGLFAAPLLAQQVPDWAAPATDNPYESSGPSIEAMSGPGLPATPAAVPLDGGLGLLALAGAGYAAKKLRDRRED